MGKEREELEKIFEIANDSFLRNNRMFEKRFICFKVERDCFIRE